MFGTIPDTWMRLHWRVELGTPPPAHPFRLHNFKEQFPYGKPASGTKRPTGEDPRLSPVHAARTRLIRPGHEPVKRFRNDFFIAPKTGVDGIAGKHRNEVYSRLK